MTEAGTRVVGGGPGSDEAAGGAPPRRRRFLRPVTLIAIAGVLGTVVFATLWAAEQREDRRIDEVRATARNFLIALTNFDGESIDADFDRIASYATDDFEDQADEFFGTDVRRALKEVQASSRGELRDVFVQSLTDGRARVFAVVDQTIANNRLPAPQADELRIELVLKHTGDGWRVADVRVLQAPPASVAAGVGDDAAASPSSP